MAAPEGEWLLNLTWSGFSRDIATTSYAVTVRYERHEHFAALDLPAATAHAFRVRFGEGEFGRVDFIFRDGADSSPRETRVLIDHEQSHWSDRWCLDQTWGFVFGVTGAPTLAWTRGVGPDAHARAPDALDQGTVRLVTHVESGGTLLGVNRGFTASNGARATAYATWDGDGFDLSYLEGATARHERLTGFDGAGPAVQAGPAATARGLTLHHAVEDTTTSLSHFWVDARQTPGQPLPPRFRITSPSGDVEEVEGVPFHSVRLYPGHEGDWRVDVLRWDGVDHADRFVFHAVSYPFPPC